MINKIISNKILFNKNKKYCCIIGLNPSKGARSPKLWNACFKKFNLDINFYCFDVELKNLKKLIDFLKSDNNFVGGAIAAPYKEDILQYVDKIDDKIKSIGSANIIFNSNKGLICTNSDGQGAVESIISDYKSRKTNLMNIKNILILGSGGTAKSISIFLSKKLGKKINIYFYGRNKNKVRNIVESMRRYSNSFKVSIKKIEKILPKTDLLINCTSIGYEHYVIDEKNNYYYYEPFTPLSEVNPSLPHRSVQNYQQLSLKRNINKISKNINNTLKKLSKLKTGSSIMDVVYQPEETLLLKLAKFYNINTISGKKMNLLQAVVGFKFCFPNLKVSISEIKTIMSKVKD